MFASQNVEFLNITQMAWFENKEKTLNLNVKLNEACNPLIYCRYKLRVLLEHCSCYSGTRSVTTKVWTLLHKFNKYNRNNILL
jgi:hypothetical protein